jgi:tetratricopeptide (TPR) repeat protein
MDHPESGKAIGSLESIKILSHMGYSSLKLKRADKAIIYFSTAQLLATQKDKMEDSVLLNLAGAYWAEGFLDLAEKTYSSTTPSSEFAHFLLYAREKQEDRVIQICQQVITQKDRHSLDRIYFPVQQDVVALEFKEVIIKQGSFSLSSVDEAYFLLFKVRMKMKEKASAEQIITTLKEQNNPEQASTTIIITILENLMKGF